MSTALQRAIVVLTCLVAPLANADSWSYPPKVEVQSFRLGNTRIDLTTDARKNRKYPEFLMEIYTGGKQVASVPGVHFEKVFASKDNRLFVGLSNRGIPGTAVVVFTDKGEVTLLVRHGMAEFDYCSKSVSLRRVWFDEENPNVQFKLEEREPKPGIYLKSCKGHDLELVRAVQDAYAKAAKGTN